MKPEGACVSWANALRNMTLTSSTSYTCTSIHPSLAYRHNLLSSLKTTERHSTLQSTLSRYQSSRDWRCRRVGGNLVRGTRDLNLAARREFPMVLGDTAGPTCARIYSLDGIRAATTAHTMRQS